PALRLSCRSSASADAASATSVSGGKRSSMKRCSQRKAARSYRRGRRLRGALLESLTLVGKRSSLSGNRGLRYCGRSGEGSLCSTISRRTQRTAAGVGAQDGIGSATTSVASSRSFFALSHHSLLLFGRKGRESLHAHVGG